MDYENDLPDLSHWKAVMEFTVEQAALLMAMIDPLDVETLAQAKEQQFPRWKKAHAHCLSIVSAIRQGMISPVICCAWVLPENYSEQPYAMNIKPSDRTYDISPAHTVISRAALLNWIETERVQVTKPASPAKLTQLDQKQAEIIEATPLALPYRGHTSEGLEFVEDAIKQLWSTYDPDDPSTAPSQTEVVEYLKGRGAGANMAQAVNLILRPRHLSPGNRKNRSAATNKS
ncbi:hypothetical protein [Pseudomonas benzenivorans]|uniref:Uncharacterized protein n=1 Tax=Pseudomonas benzenivorans TaxID=556533 RepID=A0ABY5H6D7_9PSED|nr:hypothetical protein [Pseudomonas benzenivorans]UTW07875.1 hypothetical protein KDW96_00610 [Pseudomonas benzenivorans]